MELEAAGFVVCGEIEDPEDACKPMALWSDQNEVEIVASKDTVEWDELDCLGGNESYVMTIPVPAAREITAKMKESARALRESPYEVLEETVIKPS